MRHSWKPLPVSTLSIVHCCDPRIAALTEKIEARLIRIPGSVIDPSWIGFEFLKETTGHTVAVLGHNQCLAHKSSDDAALQQVQWARNALWHQYQNRHNFVVGMVGVETLHITFRGQFGRTLNPSNMIAEASAKCGHEMRKLVSLNNGRSSTSSRGTTLLHHPVGVLAISLDGAMNCVRENDLVYVVDDIGQPDRVLDEQVRTIGRIVADNALAMGVQPHVLIAGTDNLTAAQLHAKKVQVLQALTHIEHGNTFSSEIVQRESHGQFSVISSSVSQTEPSWRLLP